jgi:predicted kinase
VIIMVGIPGSGKTFFAEKFAETFSAPYVDYKRIASLAGEEAAEVIMNDQLDELLKTKQSIILEANADTRTARAELAKKIRSAEYEPLLVWVQTDEATARARATKPSKDRPGAVLDQDTYDRKIKRFTAPTPPEKPIVISGKHTYASQAKAVLGRLSAPRAEISTHATPPTRLEQPTRRNIAVR